MDPATIAVVIAAYLIGSIDFGVIIPKLMGKDIYAHGSGNPGASNVLRSMGRKAAAVVVVGDTLKGFGAAMLGTLAVGRTVGFVCGLVAVVGHCFPVWHRFKGGKGVATGGGATLWLEPVLGGALFGLWLLVTVVFRKASLASLLCALAYVPAMYAFGNRGWDLALAAAMVALVVGRHHGNIRRLVKGSEHAIEGA